MPKKAKKQDKKTAKSPKRSKKTQAVVKERPLMITLASILFVLSAAINFFVFIQIVFLTDPAELIVVGESATLFGMIGGALGVLDLAAAYGLWKMRLFGGIVAIVDLVASVLIGFYPEPNFDALSITLLSFNAILLVMVVMSWEQLE